MKRFNFAGYDLVDSGGQLRIDRQRVDIRPGDYGYDPTDTPGMVRLVPSGRLVTTDEARAILDRK